MKCGIIHIFLLLFVKYLEQIIKKIIEKYIKNYKEFEREAYAKLQREYDIP